jgi:hypothetical protein
MAGGQLRNNGSPPEVQELGREGCAGKLTIFCLR